MRTWLASGARGRSCGSKCWTRQVKRVLLRTHAEQRASSAPAWGWPGVRHTPSCILFALWSHPAAHVPLPAAPSFRVPLEQAVELDDLQRECSEAYTMRQQLASAQQAEAQLRQQVAQLQRQAAAAGGSDLSPRSSGSSDSVSPPRTAGRAAPTVLQGRLDAATRELSAAKQEVGGVGCACSLPMCCIPGAGLPLQPALNALPQPQRHLLHLPPPPCCVLSACRLPACGRIGTACRRRLRGGRRS